MPRMPLPSALPAVKTPSAHNLHLTYDQQPETLVSNETYATEYAEIRPRSYGPLTGPSPSQLSARKACK